VTHETLSGGSVSSVPVHIIGEAGILWFGLVAFSAENLALSGKN